jgi:CubicO group peptidase (beta-lactamase class C family)
MQRILRATLAALIVAGALVVVRPLSAATATARPEDVGLSSERLKRVAELVERHITAGSFSGAVTLVARNGRIAYHEAQGLMDLETKKPMVNDGIFRIMSMTKPVIGVATLMMTQTSNQEFLRDFENMVMQAVVGSGAARSTGTN